MQRYTVPKSLGTTSTIETGIDEEQLSIPATSFLEYLKDGTVRSLIDINLSAAKHTVFVTQYENIFKNLPYSPYFDKLINKFDRFQNVPTKWFALIFSQAKKDLLEDKKIQLRISKRLGLQNINPSRDLQAILADKTIINHLIASYVELVTDLVISKRNFDLSSIQKARSAVLETIRKGEFSGTMISFPENDEDFVRKKIIRGRKFIRKGELNPIIMNTCDVAPASNEADIQRAYKIAESTLSNLIVNLNEGGVRIAPATRVLNKIKELYTPERTVELTRVLTTTTELVRSPKPRKLEAYKKQGEELSSNPGWRVGLGVLMVSFAIITSFTIIGAIGFGYSAYRLFQTPADKKAMAPLTAEMHSLAQEAKSVKHTRKRN